MAEPTDPAVAAAAPTKKGVWDWVLPVAGSIGTGIGVIGFVVFFGGMVAWARASALGVPPSLAVSQVPKAEFVATGASFLVPALMTAVGAVAASGVIAYVWPFRQIEAREEHMHKAYDDAVAAAAVAKQGVVEAEARLARADEVLRKRHDQYDALDPEDNHYEEDRERYQRRIRKAEDDRDEERMARNEAKEAVKAAIAKERATLTAEEKAAEWTRAERRIIVGTSTGTLLVITLVLAKFWNIHWTNALLVLLVIAAATAISAIIFLRTQKWGWYAVAAFLSVGVALAASTYFRTHDHPKVAPVAVLRSDGAPVVGLLVTQTPDHVLVGVPDVNPAGNRLVLDNTQLYEVPRDKVLDMAIGPELAAGRSYRRALAMAQHLCALPKVATTKQPTQPPTTKKKSKHNKQAAQTQPAAPAKQCTPAQAKAVDDLAAGAAQLPDSL